MTSTRVRRPMTLRRKRITETRKQRVNRIAREFSQAVLALALASLIAIWMARGALGYSFEFFPEVHLWSYLLK